MSRRSALTSNHLAAGIVALGAAAFLAGCGGTPAPKLNPTATCDAFLAANPRSGLHPGPVEKLVESLLGSTNVTARASATTAICIDYTTTLGLGTQPVGNVIKLTVPTCAEWLASTGATQAALVQADVGATNLTLRARGVTAECLTNTPASQPVAQEIVGLAANSSAPVNVDLSTLPPTLQPDDPDQCIERTQAIQGGTNADYLQAGLADCLAMGY